MRSEDTTGPVSHPSVHTARRSHPPRSDTEMVMDYRALRAVIGGIAFILVPAVYIGNWVFFTRHIGACFWPSQKIPGSLSGYYYTHMRNLFVGAMCAMGVFLGAYRGYDRWDNRLTNVAGFAAILIALFPTMPPFYSPSPNGPNQFFTTANPCGPVTPITYHESANQRIFGYVHTVSLIVLFVMVFLIVLVQFTRTNEADSRDRGDLAQRIRGWWHSLFAGANPKKRRRNRVYVLCAAGIALSGMLALITGIWPSAGNVAPWLLFAESGAFVFFGIAWFVKGAASAPQDSPQVLVRALSQTTRRWLADQPDRVPVS